CNYTKPHLQTNNRTLRLVLLSMAIFQTRFVSLVDLVMRTVVWKYMTASTKPGRPYATIISATETHKLFADNWDSWMGGIDVLRTPYGVRNAMRDTCGHHKFTFRCPKYHTEIVL
ncbi:hypothetical protein MAR_023524, partial [Mya arenaria]